MNEIQQAVEDLKLLALVSQGAAEGKLYDEVLSAMARRILALYENREC